MIEISSQGFLCESLQASLGRPRINLSVYSSGICTDQHLSSMPSQTPVSSFVFSLSIAVEDKEEDHST